MDSLWTTRQEVTRIGDFRSLTSSEVSSFSVSGRRSLSSTSHWSSTNPLESDTSSNNRSLHSQVSKGSGIGRKMDRVLRTHGYFLSFSRVKGPFQGTLVGRTGVIWVIWRRESWTGRIEGVVLDRERWSFTRFLDATKYRLLVT